MRDLRVVVGAERAGKAFRECHRRQTSSAEAPSDASSSSATTTTTTARKQRNPRRRVGEATQQQQQQRQGVQQQRISQLSGSAFCSSSRCSFATRYGRQKTSSSPGRRAACLFRLSSGAAEAALCAGLGRTSYPRRHRRPLLRPLPRLAVPPRGLACIACPETSWIHYSRLKETSAKRHLGLEKKQLSV